MPSKPSLHRAPGWAPFKRVRTDRIDREYGTQRWRKLALSIIERDRGICAICGLPGADTAHHKVEKREGGKDEPTNLEAVHRGCHNAAHGARGRGRG